MATTPTIRVLGPVRVENATGERCQSPARATEMIAFLALHPWDNSQLLDDALWPGKRVTATTRNHITMAARILLGAADDGRPYLPLAHKHGYRLDPDVTCDWHLFQSHLESGPHHASTAQLTAALTLVDGQPFSGVNPVRYQWAETDRNDMIELIADAAHELAERALRSKDIRTATWATGKGLQVEPIHEGLWRQALMAAASSGLPDRLATITARLHATLDPLGDLEDQTRDLLRSLHQLPGQRSALA